jgi:protein-tyrosine-phosphatase
MELKQDNPVLSDFPNPRSNVFLMMRFRDTKQHQAIEQAISSILVDYSLKPLRTDFKHYQHELWANVQAYMDASNYGIAVFEQIDEADINPNVSLELGYMLGKNKNCLLLKEKRITKLQSDLVGHLYREFDSYNIEETVKTEVQYWLRDIGIAKKSNERMLVYVSQGGTCRCAMAKIITQKLLEHNHPEFPIRVESAAYADKGFSVASNGARKAIREMFGEDLLEDHRVKLLTPTMRKEADLILVMDEKILGAEKESRPVKMQILKTFFGLVGDVLDPYLKDHGDRDEGAAIRYADCANELREILENNIHKIIMTLRPR